MTVSLYDQQSNGWRDDGTESGLIRVHNYGDLVFVPFRLGQYTKNNVSEDFGNGSTGAQENWSGANNDLRWNVASGLPQSQSNATMLFRGTTLGVVYDPSFVSSSFYKDFGMFIDGLAYRVKKQIVNPQINTTWSTSTGGHAQIVASGLPDTIHYLDLVMAGDASTQVNQRLYGLLLERRAGYAEQTRFGSLTTCAAVPTGSLTTISQAGATARNPRGIKGIIYNNTTAGALTVQIQYQANDLATSFPVPANGTANFDLMYHCTVADSDLKHKASGSGLTACLVGAN